MDFGRGAAVKPQSSAHPAEYVEHNIGDAGSTAWYECLMELVAGRVKSCQPKAEDKLPDVQFFTRLLAQGAHDQYGENKILAEMTKFPYHCVEQPDMVIRQGPEKISKRTFEYASRVARRKRVGGKNKDERGPNYGRKPVFESASCCARDGFRH